MVQIAKLAVLLVGLVLIQCVFVDAAWWRRMRRRRSPTRTPTRTPSSVKYRCRNRRSIYDTSGIQGIHNHYCYFGFAEYVNWIQVVLLICFGTGFSQKMFDENFDVKFEDIRVSLQLY